MLFPSDHEVAARKDASLRRWAQRPLDPVRERFPLTRHELVSMIDGLPARGRASADLQAYSRGEVDTPGFLRASDDWLNPAVTQPQPAFEHMVELVHRDGKRTSYSTSEIRSWRVRMDSRVQVYLTDGSCNYGVSWDSGGWGVELNALFTEDPPASPARHRARSRILRRAGRSRAVGARQPA